jgi:hypothetical protein
MKVTATQSAARQAITQALRDGDRVRFSRFSVWRFGLAALLAASGACFEVWYTIWDQYPWYSAAGAAVFSLLGLLVFAFAWESDRNAAVQFGDRSLVVWDWRGRESSVPYEEVQSVRARRLWDSWTVSFRTAEPEDSEWRQAIFYPSKDGWLITAIVDEFARRCGLIERSQGLWTRSPVDEVQ